MPSDIQNMLLKSQEVIDAAVATVTATSKTRAAFDRNIKVTDRKINDHDTDEESHQSILNKIKSGTSNIYRKTWTTAIHIVSGGSLKLPITYKVGNNSILYFSWRGYEMYPDENYKEIGNAGEQSNFIELMFSAQPGDMFSITIASVKE